MEVDTDRIIDLSRIRLETDKERVFSRQILQIISWVEEIDSVSDSREYQDVELPCTPLREDRFANSGLDTTGALANAPESDGEYFIVSEVIKK